MMLAALLVGFLLLGGAGGGIDLFGKDDRSRVKTVILEEERADQILTQMDYVERSGTDELLRVSKLLKKWRKEDRDHGVGSGALDSVVAEAKSAAESSQQHFLDGLFAMKANMSEGEWRAVFNADSEG